MRQIDAPALVPATPEANTTDLLLERVAKTPDAPLFACKTEAGWSDISAIEFLGQVRALAKGFIAAGIRPGDRIGLLSRTRYEWTLIDFAAWFSGAIIIPIYDSSSAYQIRWNLSDSKANALIVETSDHEAKAGAVNQDLPGVRQVWQIDRGDLARLAEAGAHITDAEVERRRAAAHEDDIATIIYTSGTSGDPKGCVLTHRNFVELSRNTRAAIPEVFTAGASTVLFMPMAHVFARFIALLAVDGGVRVAHQPDLASLLETLASFRPTFLLAVPRVFEKVYNSSEQKAEAGGKGRLFRMAAATAVNYSKALDAGRVPFGLRLRFALFDKLVLGKIRAALGGRIRYAVSGSAPLAEHLGHFYRGLGIAILEGYGLTETTAPSTVTRPSNFTVGTVGPALPGVSIRIADDGEIETKGINTFREYWANPEATAEAFAGAWFRTGDIGEIDSDGNLRITGRKKEILVTAGGKNVAPSVLEEPLRAHPIISQALIVGDQRPFISALVTLDADRLPSWFRSKDLDPTMTVAEAAKHPAVRDEVQRAVGQANARVSRAESIREFRILPVDFTEQAGHLTPKLSLRRGAILQQFEVEIEHMYGNVAATSNGGRPNKL